MFTGFGVGPTLGGIIMHVTGSVISVFYLATIIHLVYAALIIFVIPESLSKRRMLEARRVLREQREEAKLGPQPSALVGLFKGLFGFLKPLGVFKPVNSKKGGKDWNLLFVAMAYGSTLSVVVSKYSGKDWMCD